MLNLRRQNQRFETLIQNADSKRRLRGGGGGMLFMLTFFAFATLTQEGRSN